MEYVTVDQAMRLKEFLMPFIIFVLVPCVYWWAKAIWYIFCFIVGSILMLFGKSKPEPTEYD